MFFAHGMRRSRTITFLCPARIADLFPHPKLSEGGDMRDCDTLQISKLCRSSVIESHDLTVGCLAGNDIPQTLVPAFSEGDTEGSCTNPRARRTLGETFYRPLQGRRMDRREEDNRGDVAVKTRARNVCIDCREGVAPRRKRQYR